MENIDPAMAQRVWQRVTSAAPSEVAPASPDLQALIEAELEDAAAYLHLSRFFSDPYSRILRQMHQQEQSHAACLKGIYRMSTGRRCNPRLPRPLREKPSVTLRRCCQRELDCATQYEARSKDPVSGETFSRLAQQEREHSRFLLELLGKLQV